MDRLWAPWRIKYIRAHKKEKGCIFCRAVKSAKPDYVIFKTRHSIAMLNIFPYNNGHIMVSPKRHTAELTQLTDQEALDIFGAIIKAKKILDKILKPQGYNIGMNILRCAGAGIVAHLHIHIVPRWVGDTNFMPVVHQTKVISESLDELYKRLKRALKNA